MKEKKAQKRQSGQHISGMAAIGTLSRVKSSNNSKSGMNSGALIDSKKNEMGILNEKYSFKLNGKDDRFVTQHYRYL